VVEGDNLWVISRNRLAQVTRRPASELSDHEIAAYWLRVVAANQDDLRSRDPDLIFPGEVIQLPPISSS
jgi:nucleoid-associated protein YgaU